MENGFRRDRQVSRRADSPGRSAPPIREAAASGHPEKETKKGTGRMSRETALPVDVLKRYPRPDEERLERDYAEALGRFSSRIIVMDDDPTGVQTVHDIPVYTDWSRETFAEGFAGESAMFFILTNSRSMGREETEKVHREMAERIADVSAECGRDYTLISRSDSTMRGHYPAETEILRRVTEEKTGIRFDGEILCPFFREGGRYTIDNVHYVREGDRLVPAGQTEFARDRTFGYSSSHLGEWVEEKSGGRYRKEDCIYISLEDLRALNYEKITGQLMAAEGFRKIIVNSTEYCDVKAFTVAYINTVNRGRHFIFRSAAAVPKILGGIKDAPLLGGDRLRSAGRGNGGIIIVGSHVNKTTRQLEALKRSGLPVTFLEFSAESALRPGGPEAEKKRVLQEAEPLIRAGRTVAVYTSRKLLQTGDQDRERLLAVSVGISDALAGIVGELAVRPGFIIAKGGITSSDVGTKGLRVHRATVMGQIKPGIPVWLTGEESRFPHMPYVIFPGNVGDEQTLKEIVAELIA